MLDMSQIEMIRDMKAKGYTPSEIREITKASYPTIRKYLSMDDFSPKKPEHAKRASIIDEFEPAIRRMLDSDRHCYHKQKHTSKRIYERLVDEEGYEGSYSTVQRKVRDIRLGERQALSDAYVKLHWQPGTMQVDFGQADFDWAFGGGRVRMHYLPMSFPYSNNALCEVFGDEKDVCVCQGLKDCFERIGGVPRVIVFDNATDAGRRLRGTITESKLFRRFRLHYGFEARFCNPNSGHEKGHVESKVGWIRKNLFTPVPAIGNLRDYNEELSSRLSRRAEEEVHYEKGLSWADLFEADRAALLPMPEKAFDVVIWQACSTDGYGRISLDKGLHLYLASPDLANTSLTVGIRAFDIEIDGLDGAPIRHYERRTGSDPTCDEDPLALLDLLAAKTRAFGNSSVRALFNEQCRDHFDSMETGELRGRVEHMARLAGRYGMDTAVRAFEQTLAYTGKTNDPDVEMSAARISFGARPLEPHAEYGTKIVEYDSLIGERSRRHG